MFILLNNIKEIKKKYCKTPEFYFLSNLRRKGEGNE